MAKAKINFSQRESSEIVTIYVLWLQVSQIKVYETKHSLWISGHFPCCGLGLCCPLGMILFYILMCVDTSSLSSWWYWCSWCSCWEPLTEAILGFHLQYFMNLVLCSRLLSFISKDREINKLSNRPWSCQCVLSSASVSSLHVRRPG